MKGLFVPAIDVTCQECQNWTRYRACEIGVGGEVVCHHCGNVHWTVNALMFRGQYFIEQSSNRPENVNPRPKTSRPTSGAPAQRPE